MALIGNRVEPPDEGAGALEYVLWLARDEFGCRKAHPCSALDQDLGIVGDDVDDFVEKLAERFGEWVFEWPWERFVCLDEGIPILAPFIFLWEFLRLPWRDTALPKKDHMERLELAHIAKVLEHGEWVEP